MTFLVSKPKCQSQECDIFGFKPVSKLKCHSVDDDDDDDGGHNVSSLVIV